MEETESGVYVSGKELKDVLDLGPDHSLDVLKEYCKDVETLTRSMRNLYSEHLIELSILGVSVKVQVTSVTLHDTMLDMEFGMKGDIEDVLRNPVKKEEANE